MEIQGKKNPKVLQKKSFLHLMAAENLAYRQKDGAVETDLAHIGRDSENHMT